MYYVCRRKKIKKKWKYGDFEHLVNLKVFVLPTKSDGFNICGVRIKNIEVIDNELGRPLVSEYVSKKYRKLLKQLTELLISDDDTGESFRLVLDRIEKFRQEIKNKYRRFLEKKELEIMAKQLSALQKQAKIEFAELQNNLMNSFEQGKNR